MRRRTFRWSQNRDALTIGVVGAGIVGLAHAWIASRAGHRVILFERHPSARGASIRNFGMVWPIGQPNGPRYSTALRSRSLWCELLSETGFWHGTSGSLHLAYRDDELAVLEEFAQLSSTIGIECRLLRKSEVLEISPPARRASSTEPALLGGLLSKTELCVNPREIIYDMPRWLEEKYGVELYFETPVTEVLPGRIATANGANWGVDRVIVATGADFKVLFPDVFARTELKKCKLQMMRTVRQPGGWKLGPMIASGLTLRHYESFGVCRQLPALKRRIAEETPELDKYGIHVMAAQNGSGHVILGDSHEYDEDISPFDKTEIDQLILRELRKIIDLPDWTIEQHWSGVYPKFPGTIQFRHQVHPGIDVTIASGGSGMTMSFGLADAFWNYDARPMDQEAPVLTS